MAKFVPNKRCPTKNVLFYRVVLPISSYVVVLFLGNEKNTTSLFFFCHIFLKNEQNVSNVVKYTLFMFDKIGQKKSLIFCKNLIPIFTILTSQFPHM